MHRDGQPYHLLVPVVMISDGMSSPVQGLLDLFYYKLLPIAVGRIQLRLKECSSKDVFAFVQASQKLIFLTLILLTWRIGRAPNNARKCQMGFNLPFNPLNAELNLICYLLALLGAHHLLHVSRVRVKSLTLRLLMSYIYIYIYMTLVA